MTDQHERFAGAFCVLLVPVLALIAGTARKNADPAPEPDVAAIAVEPCYETRDHTVAFVSRSGNVEAVFTNGDELTDRLVMRIHGTRRHTLYLPCPAAKLPGAHTQEKR